MSSAAVNAGMLTHTRTHTRVHDDRCVYVGVHARPCSCVCAHVLACLNLRMCVCCLSAHHLMCVFVYACVRVCVSICVRVCRCINTSVVLRAKRILIGPYKIARNRARGNAHTHTHLHAHLHNKRCVCMCV